MQKEFSFEGVKVILQAEMGKSYKIAHTKFDSKKLAHKICAKHAQNRGKLAKILKIAQKRQKKL